MRAMYLLLLAGAGLLAAVLLLFWLKDRLRSPLLARVAYSEAIARVAVAGGALVALGLLLLLGELFSL
jgi:hypothetical protein